MPKNLTRKAEGVGPRWWHSEPWPRWVLVGLALWSVASLVTDIPGVLNQTREMTFLGTLVVWIVMITHNTAIALAAWRGSVGLVVIVIGALVSFAQPIAPWTLLVLAGVLLVISTVSHLVFVLMAGATVGILSAAVMVADEELRPFSWIYLLVIAVGTVFCWMIASTRRRRDEAEQELVARQNLQDQAVLNERERIAQDLHDVVAHSMTVSVMHTRLAFSADDHAGKDQHLAVAENASEQALHDLRVVMRALGTKKNYDDQANTSPWDLAAEIESCDEQLSALGYQVRRQVDGNLTEVSDTLAVVLAPVLREATTNVVKYGLPGVAVLRLSITDSSVTLELTTPVDARPAKHQPVLSDGFGLRGMRERLNVVNGTLRAESMGSTWTVLAEVPRAL